MVILASRNSFILLRKAGWTKFTKIWNFMPRKCGVFGDKPKIPAVLFCNVLQNFLLAFFT